MNTILEPILKAVNPKALIDELNQIWEAEQQKRHAFWADIDENVKAEFIEGEIIYHSPVYRRHWKVSTNLLGALIPYTKKNDLGEIGAEKVMVRCTRNDYEPDICFWTKEVSETFTSKQSAFPPPVFIVEILSDSTEKRDRGIKFIDYAKHGVTEYWIIDTDTKTIEQYILNTDKMEYDLNLKVREGKLKSVAIKDFEIDVQSVF
jgi:Uma2 family endonuclease